MNSIFTRRSVRQYLNKGVEQSKIKRLLAAAMQAPSAYNQQCWEFVVIQDKAQLQKVSGYTRHAAMLAQAPLGIVVLGNTERMIMPEKWQQDLGAATQNLLLEAVNQELGAVWLGVYGDKEHIDTVSKMLDLPKHIIPYAVISIGYPANEDANRFVDRFDDSKIHFEKY